MSLINRILSRVETFYTYNTINLIYTIRLIRALFFLLNFIQMISIDGYICIKNSIARKGVINYIK
jgi:hypothetical protein